MADKEHKAFEGSIHDLVFDDKNFNKHTEFGMGLLDKSLRQHGAARSIVVDKNNRIIGGNGIVETAAAIGLEKTIIVETTGEELVVVKRTDVDLDSKEGREMALADNATASADLEWDNENIQEVAAEYEISPDEWGVHDWQEESQQINLDGFFGQEESKKDNGLKITIAVSENQKDKIEDIKAALRLTLEEWEGCEIK